MKSQLLFALFLSIRLLVMVASEEIDDAYCPVDEEDKIRQVRTSDTV